MGLRVVVLGNFVIINNPNNAVRINGQKLKSVYLTDVALQGEIEEDLEIYDEEDYFFRNPRFKRNITEEKYNIDSPPENQNPEGTPFLLTMASSMTMAASSSMSLYTVIARLEEGADPKDLLPSLLLTGTMLFSSLLIPIITRIYEKHKNKKQEKLRQDKYSNYLDERKIEIDNKIIEQKAILIENNTTNEKCFSMIMNKESSLWERKIIHDDFLNLRVGIGDIDAKIEVNYEKERFTLVEDNLKNKLHDLGGSDKKIKNVPVTISLTEKNIVAVTSDAKNGYAFLETLMLQLLAYHSYEDLKIVILTQEENEGYFEFLKLTPFVQIIIKILEI